MFFSLGLVPGFFLRVGQLISHGLGLWQNDNSVVTRALSLKPQILLGAAYGCRKPDPSPAGASEAVSRCKPCAGTVPDPKAACSWPRWGASRPQPLLAPLPKDSPAGPRKRVWRSGDSSAPRGWWGAWAGHGFLPALGVVVGRQRFEVSANPETSRGPSCEHRGPGGLWRHPGKRGFCPQGYPRHAAGPCFISWGDGAENPACLLVLSCLLPPSLLSL